MASWKSDTGADNKQKQKCPDRKGGTPCFEPPCRTGWCGCGDFNQAKNHTCRPRFVECHPSLAHIQRLHHLNGGNLRKHCDTSISTMHVRVPMIAKVWGLVHSTTSAASRGNSSFNWQSGIRKNSENSDSSWCQTRGLEKKRKHDPSLFGFWSKARRKWMRHLPPAALPEFGPDPVCLDSKRSRRVPPNSARMSQTWNVTSLDSPIWVQTWKSFEGQSKGNNKLITEGATILRKTVTGILWGEKSIEQFNSPLQN